MTASGENLREVLVERGLLIAQRQSDHTEMGRPTNPFQTTSSSLRDSSETAFRFARFDTYRGFSTKS